MAPKSIKKIFITGGHYTPAKAVIDKLEGWKIFYVGRKYAMEDSNVLALEYQELQHLNYLCITTGRLQRKFFVNVWQSIRSLLKIPVGFLQSFWWLLRYQPNVILSFGGYVALPIVINAWILDIPVLTHEQTKTIGLANRIIRLFGAKVLDVGVPLRQEILNAKVSKTNTIFVTGGNQGSKIIFDNVKKIIPKLSKYKVILNDKPFRAKEMADNLSEAGIIISRAGANTVSEIAYLGKPAILIPIPWSSGGEQEKNAQELEKLGMAEIINQDNLSEKTLLEAIEKIDKNYDKYWQNAKKGKTLVDPHAADKIVEEINVILEAAKGG